MKFIGLYIRVLKMLGAEARLGWILAVANLLLAGAMFAEPILFGRIIDTLANSQSRAAELDWNRLVLLLGAWVGFALFTIVSGTLISLHADRLSHRQYQVVRTMFFEHVLQLPLELSHRRAFRPAGEGDGHRHQHAVEPVAGVLPRALREPRLAPRAAAGHAVPQLALWPAADRAVRACSRC